MDNQEMVRREQQMQLVTAKRVDTPETKHMKENFGFVKLNV